MGFGNKSVGVPVLRGVLGFAALWGGAMCWTMGLIETVAMRIHRRAAGTSESVRAAFGGSARGGRGFGGPSGWAGLRCVVFGQVRVVDQDRYPAQKNVVGVNRS
jgi:hypothetical protein